MKKVLCILSIALVGYAPAAELGRSKPPVQQATGGAIGGGPATGLQLSLFPPAQIFNESYDVSGLRLSLIYGRNQNVRGLDLGLVNEAKGEAEGLQLGLVNLAGSLRGVQISAINSATDAEGGAFQLGVFNRSETFRGFQCGVFNMTGEMQGLQLGLINFCENTSGVQIGLLNFITQSEAIIFCPIFNAQF